MSQIKATIIADSSCNGSRITTYEIEVHRFIWSEFMTHRQFSRNAASSRAIPIDTQLKMVEESPATPVHWGLNQSGMQASNEHASPASCEWAWKKAATNSMLCATMLKDLGLHKQLVNRVLEPFQMIKAVVTATEYDNFFYLRNHKDAQPEIAELAKLMYDARCKSTPNDLKAGEWHLPYVKTFRSNYGGVSELEDHIIYTTNYVEWGDKDDTATWNELTLEDAIKVSASCCAQVSYRKQDESLEKALKIWDMLVTMKPVHASPFEHQASPMLRTNVTISENRNDPTVPAKWQDGVTHFDKEAKGWSANFKGWIQHRQLIDNNVCNNYEETK